MEAAAVWGTMKFVSSRRTLLGVGEPYKRLGKPQLVGGTIAFCVYFLAEAMTQPELGYVSALACLGLFVLSVWIALMTIISVYAFFLDAEDDSLVWLAAWGGEAGCILELFRGHVPWNYPLTALFQMGGALLGLVVGGTLY